MATPRRKKAGAAIPTASMADIAFLLIIFFLLTTAFNQEMGLTLTLPPVSEDQEVRIQQRNILNIWVNAAGEILLAEEVVTLPQVAPEVRRRIADNPLLIVSLKSDRATRYEDFIRVLDQLKAANATRISLADPD
jgi:biopolymer transport protein ExbD